MARQVEVNEQRAAALLRTALQPITVEPLPRDFEEFKIGGGPWARTLQLEASSGNRWLVTLGNSFARDLHNLSSLGEIVAAARLILSHPAGCHVRIDIGRVELVESGFTDSLARKGEYAAVL